MQPAAQETKQEIRGPSFAPTSAANHAADPDEGLSAQSAQFWQKHPGLVWSNRNAGDGVRIRAALMRPMFSTLLDIAVHFGLERLEHEWSVLLTDAETDTERVEPTVSRILKNIRRGYEQACA
jgi:hypothetical protein